MKRARYVYDSGAIVRMTERRFREYLVMAKWQAEHDQTMCSPEDYGTTIAIADFNATRAGADEYAEALRALDRIEAARKEQK